MPRLSKWGFKFYSSQLELRRDREEFVDVVKFFLSPGVSHEACKFTSGWRVESRLFATQYKMAWGVKPASDAIAVAQDWNLRGWPRSSLGFALSEDSEQCATEMTEFFEGASLVGLPFLKRIDSFIAAAEWAIEEDQVHTAAELLFLENQVDRAIRLVNASLFEVEKRNLSSKAIATKSLLDLRSRLEKPRDA